MSSVTLEIDSSDYDRKMPNFQRVLMNLPAIFLQQAIDEGEQEMRTEIPIQSGKLQSSVTSQVSGLEGSIRTNTGYGEAVDKGRGPLDIFPKRGKFLRFFMNGKIVFARESHPGPAAANNFTERVIQTIGGRMMSMMGDKMKQEFKAVG